MKAEMTKKYMTEKEVAEFTAISISTLRNDRFLGKGIPYIKIGRSVRYSLVDVIDLTFAIPAATTAAADIKLNGGGADFKATLAPAKVSLIACTIAIAFPNLLFCPTIFARLPKASVINCCLDCCNFFSFASSRLFACC